MHIVLLYGYTLDVFLLFDVHRYNPVVTSVQYFITNTLVLAC